MHFHAIPWDIFLQLTMLALWVCAYVLVSWCTIVHGEGHRSAQAT